MKQVWKYTLPGVGIGQLGMQRGAKILHVENQHEQICLWALVDPGEPMELRQFAVVGTGFQIAEVHCQHFLGTVLMTGGNYVWHVFEVI